MEIKLQDSFKEQIMGKALDEYVNRKDSCGYHDVTPEQFISVGSAVLHALESYGDLLFPIINKEVQEIEDLKKASFEIDDILYKKLNPIKEVIREGLKLHAFHGSDLINLNGDFKEDTKKMFEYVMNTTDIYDKAYVMQSVVDRVLTIYFNTLKEIKGDI